MAESRFAEAIQKLANAPTEDVFESAMGLIKEVQNMNEKEVVAFWRATRMFWELNPGRNTSSPPVVRHLLETAWARMNQLKSETGGNFRLRPATRLIDEVFANYSDKAAT